MGSSGTGRLTDYTGTTSSDAKHKTGGSSGEDKCGKAFTTSLEDVERSEYFIKNPGLPPSKTQIEVVFKRPRLVAIANGMVIGNLPTDRNYLKLCLESGYKFPGIVSLVRGRPVSSIEITVAPHK